MTVVETIPVSTNSAVNFDLANSRSILVAKLDNIGDFILATPFLRGLRHSAPNACISLLVTPAVFPVAESCPFVDRVLSVSKDGGTMQITGSTQPVTKAIMADFGAKKFDLAIVPRWDYDYFEAAALCRMSGARHVVGFSMAEWYHSKPPYAHHFTSVLSRPFAAHEVEHNLALLEFLGGTLQGDELELWMLPHEMKQAAKRLAALPGEGPIVTICPGASLPCKMLPPRKLKSILYRVQANIPNIRFLVLGQDSERPAADVLTGELSHCFSFCGQTNIRQTIALIASTQALIGMDSGPGHIAAAAEVPVAVFSCFGKNGNPIADYSPVRWRPRGKAENLVIQPEVSLWPCTDYCLANGYHCTTSILEEESAQAITDLVKRAIAA
jgi:ADP-heptose:LPS heptosyltransferase